MNGQNGCLLVEAVAAASDPLQVYQRSALQMSVPLMVGILRKLSQRKDGVKPSNQNADDGQEFMRSCENKQETSVPRDFAAFSAGLPKRQVVRQEKLGKGGSRGKNNSFTDEIELDDTDRMPSSSIFPGESRGADYSDSIHTTRMDDLARAGALAHMLKRLRQAGSELRGEQVSRVIYALNELFGPGLLKAGTKSAPKMQRHISLAWTSYYTHRKMGKRRRNTTKYSASEDTETREAETATDGFDGIRVLAQQHPMLLSEVRETFASSLRLAAARVDLLSAQSLAKIARAAARVDAVAHAETLGAILARAAAAVADGVNFTRIEDDKENVVFGDGNQANKDGRQLLPTQICEIDAACLVYAAGKVLQAVERARVQQNLRRKQDSASRRKNGIQEATSGELGYKDHRKALLRESADHARAFLTSVSCDLHCGAWALLRHKVQLLDAVSSAEAEPQGSGMRKGARFVLGQLLADVERLSGRDALSSLWLLLTRPLLARIESKDVPRVISAASSNTNTNNVDDMKEAEVKNDVEYAKGQLIERLKKLMTTELPQRKLINGSSPTQPFCDRIPKDCLDHTAKQRPLDHRGLVLLAVCAGKMESIETLRLVQKSFVEQSATNCNGYNLSLGERSWSTADLSNVCEAYAGADAHLLSKSNAALQLNSETTLKESEPMVPTPGIPSTQNELESQEATSPKRGDHGSAKIFLFTFSDEEKITERKFVGILRRAALGSRSAKAHELCNIIWYLAQQPSSLVSDEDVLALSARLRSVLDHKPLNADFVREAIAVKEDDVDEADFEGENSMLATNKIRKEQVEYAAGANKIKERGEQRRSDRCQLEKRPNGLAQNVRNPACENSCSGAVVASEDESNKRDLRLPEFYMDRVHSVLARRGMKPLF
ncbi:unnamed protein product [Amoebophrya sp. A25]|nr:unnamed protein product [Amoebophrya sp. A25]|eukprot:GSA25T00015611001.1